jgi:PAS domain S-box-containing protein
VFIRKRGWFKIYAVMKSAPQKNSFFSSILSPLIGGDQIALEKARLEAFLNAFPGEYCGFHEDGSVAYSDGFCAMLNLPGVKTVEDIQAALAPGDSAALEGQFLILEQEGKSFSLRVQTEGGKKTFRLRGAAGAAVNGRDKFRILWLEDISAEDNAQIQLKKAREAAEKQLEIKKGSLDTLPIPLWLRDGTGEIVWVNKAYAAMHGLPQTEITVSQVEIMTSLKSGARTLKDMARDALTEGRPQSIHSHVIVNGKRRWMELQEIPLPGTHQTLGIARDITREEEIQTELDRHTAANKSLLEQLRSAIAIFSADQSLEFFNSAYSAQWGLEEQWLNSRPKLGDILEKLRENRRLPEQADFRKWKQGWLDMFTRLIDPYEDMMYLPDGSAVRLLIVPHPMGGLMMTFEDVTSRLELESSYNTLIAVQKETLDNLAEGVVVYGGDGRLKLWNPSFADIWKLNPEELEGGPHINKIVDRKARFFEQSDWPSNRKSLIEQGLERNEQEGNMTRNDGVHLRYATVPLPDGGVMVSYYDITDSTRVENALREKNAALEAAEQLKTDFLANVSYQLRTPLNAIMGFSEILGHQYFGPLNDRQKEYSSGIHESGQRLLSLIDDILDLSTIEAGYLELKKEPVPVKPLLESLYDLSIEWARKRKLDIKLSCPNNIGSISADVPRLKQAIMNLIRNAINFTPEGGKINISANKNGDSVEISIVDTGIGIAGEDLKRIFEPFVRAPAGRSGTGNAGAGLGLALVKNIVVLHGGEIKIESRENEGTTVRVRLKTL